MSQPWPIVPLGAVLHLQRRWVKLDPTATYREIGVRSFGKGIFHKTPIQGSTLGNKRVLRIEPGDLVFNNVFAWEGAVAVAGPEEVGMIGSHRFVTYTVNPEKSTAEFLKTFFATTRGREILLKASPGSAGRNKTLGLDRFIAQSVPLPPLAEQRLIVAKIDALAAKIEEARSLRQESLKQAEALFEASVGNCFSPISIIPKRRLESLASKIGSGSTPPGGRAAYPPTGVPFIRSLNVRMRRFQWDDIAFISDETHARMSGTSVQPGDVLLNITGASIGRVACAPDDIREANVNQHVAIIRPTEVLDARYLMYWLSQPTIQDVINNEQKGATRQGFTKRQIAAFEIPLPPLVEQRRLVTDLDRLQAVADRLKALQAETAAELGGFLPSILDRAFQGELA